MEIKELKIELIKKILTIDSVEIIESITSFVNDEIELDSGYNKNFINNEDEETQKGIETILKMVNEFK
ncbi:hypothetical protein LXD69_14740 [Flavobacterium sediminilitoris]|uniref:Uncharacterized protein n=1 Tax=Flavobacterium sediminilitoris TaxID=2024526 RepID=A0ABY4HN95_9FLAO|nr:MULTISPECIES: hypothetical protein [Flavobacterium]UOX33289.1 hypothetical protein LXD69_14740 [Flavobacterium sediminilitoris]